MGYFSPPGWLVELGIFRRPTVEAPVTLAAPDPTVWLVAYATQMGTAERLAHETTASIVQAGATAELLSFDVLSPARLARGQSTLVIASTSYAGDAPDMAEAFESMYMQAPASLGGLRFGLLALGDRGYPDFCAFGRRLHAWLLPAARARCSRLSRWTTKIRPRCWPGSIRSTLPSTQACPRPASTPEPSSAFECRPGRSIVIAIGQATHMLPGFASAHP